MQTVTADQATLLTSPALSVSAGCERLNAALTVVEDISDDLAGGKVVRNLYADIHGTCDLQISRELVWGVDLVRPYMTLTDTTTGLSARWSVGVFCLTTPSRQVGEDPVTFDVQGYDRLYLLNRQVGADYSIAAGTTYRTALLGVFAAAGLTGVLIDGAAAESVLPVTRDWLLVARSTDPDQTSSPVTWLRIVNDLLTAINFRSVWADENGLFRCQQYAPPSQRPVEFTFDTDTLTTIVGEQRTSVEDVWKAPNKWVFIRSNLPNGSPAATEGAGIYTVVNQSDGPTSIDARGLTWPAVYSYEAASQEALVAIGDARVDTDRRGSRLLEVTTGPFPCAGHADIYRLVDSELGDLRVQARSFDFDLTGSDVKHQWEVVR